MDAPGTTLDPFQTVSVERFAMLLTSVGSLVYDAYSRRPAQALSAYDAGDSISLQTAVGEVIPPMPVLGDAGEWGGVWCASRRL